MSVLSNLTLEDLNKYTKEQSLVVCPVLYKSAYFVVTRCDGDYVCFKDPDSTSPESSMLSTQFNDIWQEKSGWVLKQSDFDNYGGQGPTGMAPTSGLGPTGTDGGIQQVSEHDILHSYLSNYEAEPDWSIFNPEAIKGDTSMPISPNA